MVNVSLIFNQAMADFMNVVLLEFPLSIASLAVNFLHLNVPFLQFGLKYGEIHYSRFVCQSISASSSKVPPNHD